MVIEFLTRFPAAECVVTTASLPFWDVVFDLFPKTLFQVFQSPLETPPRPNVIRHGAFFDSQAAPRWAARGGTYNLLFGGDSMESQMQIYLQAKPSAALLWVTEPVHDYLDGELVYPLHCSLDSGLCGLVPFPGQARVVPYSACQAGVWDFQLRSRQPGSAYDADMEDLILAAYARTSAGLSDGPCAMLAMEMTRNSLPPTSLGEVTFWEPQALSPKSAVALPSEWSDLEAIIAAASGVLFPQPHP